MLSGVLCAAGGAITSVGLLRVEMMGTCSSMFEDLASTTLAGKEGNTTGEGGPDGDLTISPQSSSSSSGLPLRGDSVVSSLLSPGGSMPCLFLRPSPDAGGAAFVSSGALVVGRGECAVAGSDLCTTCRCFPTRNWGLEAVVIARDSSASPKLAIIPLPLLVGEVLQPNCATGLALVRFDGCGIEDCLW